MGLFLQPRSPHGSMNGTDGRCIRGAGLFLQLQRPHGACVCVCVSTYHLSTPGTIVQLSETASKILEARHQLLLILCIADPVKIILDLRTKRSAVRSLQVTNDRKGKRRVEAAIWNFNFVSVHNVTMFTVFTVNQQLTIMAWQ